MKCLIVIAFISLSTSGFAANWKLVAEDQNCPGTVQVFAKEGERFVLVKQGETVEKLWSRDGSNYNPDKMSSTEFSSGPYTFTQPSVVENNSPKLDIIRWNRKTHCRMVTK